MNLLTKAASGERLSPQEAVGLYDLPLFDLAAAAHAVRQQRTDPGVVTYLIDRNINYSNVCKRRLRVLRLLPHPQPRGRVHAFIC